MRPRGSPLPSSLGAASESPREVAGAAATTVYAQFLEREEEPELLLQAGRRGNPGPSRAARAPPRGRLPPPGQDSPSLGA